jgi:hypothetical protein
MHARVLQLRICGLKFYVSLWYGLMIGRKRVIINTNNIFPHQKPNRLSCFTLSFSWHGANCMCLVGTGTYASLSQPAHQFSKVLHILFSEMIHFAEVHVLAVGFEVIVSEAVVRAM